MIVAGVFFGYRSMSGSHATGLQTLAIGDIELRQAANTPQPIGEVSPTATPSASETVTPTEPAALASSTPFPMLIAEIPLAPAGEQLTDMVLDTALEHLYVSDSSGQLHILDSNSYESLATFPAGKQITYDPEHQRLYLNSPTGSTLTVVDTAALTVTATLSATGQLGIDPIRNRLYLGGKLTRVYDGDTLALLYEIEIPVDDFYKDWTPIYNPLRDEMYLYGFGAGAYVLNPETGAMLDTSVPAGFKLHIFPEENIAVASQSGYWLPTRHSIVLKLFDATTLTELPSAAQPGVEFDCFEGVALAAPIDGLTYRHKYISTRDENHYYVEVYDAQGNIVTWRDGMLLGRTNPRTRQMYQDSLVLDLPSLKPIGALPPLDCIHLIDHATGRFYAKRQGTLLVFRESGAASPTGTPVAVAGFAPGGFLYKVQLSPDYDRDRTVFINKANHLYRSQDGGQHWVELQGGLDPSQLDVVELVFSPDYANDQTLFIHNTYQYGPGDGVYRSTNGGDTWEFVWTGQPHLYVNGLRFSPQYATDGQMLAYVTYANFPDGTKASLVYHSTDQGSTWQSVESDVLYADYQPEFTHETWQGSPPAHQTSESPYRIGVKEDTLVYVTDGITREIVAFFPAETHLSRSIQEHVIQSGETFYIWGEYALLRSTDDAVSWEQWADLPENFMRLPQELNDPEAIVLDEVTLLPTDDGRHNLLIINDEGQYLVAAPETLEWQQIDTRDHFTKQWQALGGNASPLGQPLTPVMQVDLFTQPFERGLWWHLKQLDQFYFLTFASPDGVESGPAWSRYQNEWEGEPNSGNYPCPEAAPHYLHDEEGWLWCQHQQTFGVPAGTRRAWLGWYQKFEGGVMLATRENDTVHVLFDEGGWETTGPLIKELLPVIPTATPPLEATANLPSPTATP